MKRRSYLTLIVFYTLFLSAFSIQKNVSAEENLIPNPSFETQGTNNNPLYWNKSGYGTNTRVFTYPVTGQNGAKAVQIEIKSYSGGDARWHFDEINVTGGEKYVYSQVYKSNVTSGLTIRYQKEGSSTYYYAWIANPGSSSDWKTFTKEFTMPSGAKKMTINISDLEKTSILRRWVSKNTQWDGLNNVIPTEFDLDENARMYKLLKKQPKLLCQPIARILTQLYDLYEIKSYRYHFGLLEQWNHVFNLVQIKWKNKTILAIQDASFNIEYLNENGDPYDFFEFLQLLKNKKDLYLSFYQENFLVKVRCYDNLNKCSYIDDKLKALHLRFRITTLEKNIKALTYPRKIDSTRDFDKASKLMERIKTILKT